MPHIVLEYSADSIDDAQLNYALKHCFDACIEFDCIRPLSLKLRAHAVLNAYYGNQADSFVHVTAHLLKGRTVERKAAISKTILDSIMTSLPHIDAVSVDVLEMDGDVYQKNK